MTTYTVKVEAKFIIEADNEGEIYGIDTAHCHNENMTISEKITDAENQILELILTHDRQ